MAHPHPTPDVPGNWPHLRDEVALCTRVDEAARLLLSALGPDAETHPSIVPGHVCATAWVFSPDGAHVLLVEHRLFKWSSPGGHIEPHETSRDGGLRELEEETGLTRFDVVAIRDVPALVHVFDLPGDRPHRHWNVAWLYTAQMDTPLSPGEGARWWSVDALPVGAPDLHSTVHRLAELLV